MITKALIIILFLVAVCRYLKAHSNMAKLNKEFTTQFDQPRMREKLYLFLFLGLQLAAGIMLLTQFLKALIGFDVSD